MSFEKIKDIEDASESFISHMEKKQGGVEQKIAKVSRHIGVAKKERASKIRAKKAIAALAGKSEVSTLPQEVVTQVSKRKGRVQAVLPKKINEEAELPRGEIRRHEEVAVVPEEELKEKSEKRREPSRTEELPQPQPEKDSLEQPPKGKMPRLFDLSDREIVNLLPRPLGERYSKLVEVRNTIEVILKRLYFETQGGPTRRALSKPGDIAVQLEDLDGSTREFMFINFYKNMKAFYDHLPEEDKLKNGTLFQNLFEKLEKARPLFLLSAEKSFEVQDTFDQLHALKEGESILLPGGFHLHAVLYEVKKERDGKFSFTIFNSGQGIETYHREIGRKYSNVRIRNIDPAKLDKLFLEKLCLGGSFFESAESLYTRLQSLGTLEFDESAHYDQGKIASCAYQCLLRWLKEQMRKDLYYELRNYTVQALLDDCVRHFDGQVRDDGSVRKIKVGGDEIQVADIAKLRKYAERYIQKIGRNIQIDKAVEEAIAIADKASQTKSLQSLVDKEEIQKTILDDLDRCLVLLKISNSLASRGSAFLESAKLIRDQAISEAEKIKEPEKRATAYYEIANTLFIQKNNTEAFMLIELASNTAKLISDPKKRAKACSGIADTLFMRMDETKALILLGNAIEAAKQISDLEKRTEVLLELENDICAIAKKLVAQGDKDGSNRALLLTFEAAREIPDPKKKSEALLSIAILFFQGDKDKSNSALLLALEAAKEITDPNSKCQKLNDIAQTLSMNNDKGGSNGVLSLALETAKEIDQRQLFLTTNDDYN